MPGRSFLDSNVLLYTDDRDEPVKRQRALDLLSELMGLGTAVVSTQVLQEYFNIATHKLSVPIALARSKVEIFSRLNLFQVGLLTILSATELVELHSVSFWDALIIRAAQEAGCDRLYSEDLQDGRRFQGLEIVNPFL